MMFFGSLSSVNPLECISMNNQECKVRVEIGIVNSNGLVFYHFSIKTSKCSGRCNIVAMEVVISMIPMQNCMFLMLL